VVKDQGYLLPQKSVFSRIIGDSHFELVFAGFLENCEDIISYAKNYLAVNFKLDYVNADGDISNYYPDFIVKLSGKKIVIVETKGLEDLDVPLKMMRLKQWCEDVNRVQDEVTFDYVFVDQEGFEKYQPKNFSELASGFIQYKP
jgi:type III restriction enzyme